MDSMRLAWITRTRMLTVPLLHTHIHKTLHASVWMVTGGRAAASRVSSISLHSIVCCCEWIEWMHCAYRHTPVRRLHRSIVHSSLTILTSVCGKYEIYSSRLMYACNTWRHELTYGTCIKYDAFKCRLCPVQCTLLPRRWTRCKTVDVWLCAFNWASTVVAAALPFYEFYWLPFGRMDVVLIAAAVL